MKLIANSLIPTNPLPYMHLDYDFTVQSAASAPYFFVAIVSLYVAIRIWKKSKLVCLLLTIGTLLCGRRAAHTDWLASAPRMSNAFAMSILTHMQNDLQNGKAIPDDLPAYLTEIHFPHQADGWDHPFRFVKQEKDAQTIYLLISAGPDGRFDTPDDMTWKMTPERPIERMEGKAVGMKQH